MNKKILIASIFISIMLLVPMTSVVGVSDIEEICDCQVLSKRYIVRTERLLSKLEVYINIIWLKFGYIPEIAEECNKILDTIYPDGLNEIFCEILKRIGILIEELRKIFPEGTIIYPILVLMMFPIILLWNEYCDEFFISYDLSLIWFQHKNHMTYKFF